MNNDFHLLAERLINLANNYDDDINEENFNHMIQIKNSSTILKETPKLDDIKLIEIN